MKDSLLIFDMDNTLLHSHIDFTLMKHDVRVLLAEEQLVFNDGHSVSDNLSSLFASGALSDGLNRRIWQRISEIEEEGLAQAVLEPGIEQILPRLSKHFHLAVLSNNMDAAVHQCLADLHVSRYFTLICGREKAPALKPRPDGVRFIASQFAAVSPARIWMIGDALIDAQAAYRAQIGFIAYNRSRYENWWRLIRQPQLFLYKWDEKAVADILKLTVKGK